MMIYGDECAVNAIKAVCSSQEMIFVPCAVVGVLDEKRRDRFLK